jgi:phosphoglycolate phosphatase
VKLIFITSDCDGVLWVDNNAIRGSSQLLNKLRVNRKNIIFVTNNDTKSRAEFREKLRKLGSKADVNEVYPVSYLIADYLKSRNFNRKAYTVY